MKLRQLQLFVCLLLVALAAHARAQTEGIVAWQVTRFDVTATLPASNTNERALTARAVLTARNVGNIAGRTFTVRLNPAAEITSVTVDSASATFTKREDSRTKTQQAQINLPAPYQPGASVNVAIEYRLTLSAQNNGVAAISPEGAQFLPLSFWYPAPNTPYAVRGADYAPTHLTVNAAGGTTVISSGQATCATLELKLYAPPFFLIGEWETVEEAGG